MSVHGRTLGDLLAPLRETYFISGEINTRMPDMDTVQATMDRLAGALPRRARVPTRRRLGRYDSWHFNVRPRTRSPDPSHLEATSRAEMEQRRDEVLAMVRR